MNSFFIKKILPVLSGLFLLASLFLFFKMTENKIEVTLKNKLTQNYKVTNRIINRANNSSYEMMQEMTNHRPDDTPLMEAMVEVMQISQKAKTALLDIFKNNSIQQNKEINQIISDYQTNIYTLLDKVEKSEAIISRDGIKSIKSNLHFDTIPSSSKVSAFQESIILNGINANSFNLVRYFPSHISANVLIFDRFQPMISLSSVSKNNQIFKVYLSHPQSFPSINNFKVYCNNQSMRLNNNYEGILKILIKDASNQTLILSADWESEAYPNLNLPSTTSISDTISLILSN
jgi:hypothetical protein